MSIQHWTIDQWAVFSLTLGAGVAAVALALAAWRAVRGWTAPATYRRAPLRAQPRPTLTTAAGRRALPALTGEYQVVDTEHPSLTSGAHVADALLPGVGSLAALAAVGEGSLTRVVLVDRDIAVAVAVALAPCLEAFRIAMEPLMRQAHLWELRGQEGRGAAPHARVELAHWREFERTGEYAMVAS